MNCEFRCADVSIRCLQFSEKEKKEESSRILANKKPSRDGESNAT